MRIVAGTRGSQLATIQAKEAIAAVERAAPETELELRTVKTAGDAFRGQLSAAPAKGIFVREIDEMVLSGGLDAGIHSLKDVPTELPNGLTIAAVLERRHPGDLLFSRVSLDELPQGALVGTSSPRRRAQLLRRRSDLRMVELRGNVPTRIRKQLDGEVAAAGIAKAAAARLGVTSGFFELPLSEFPHAPGQGAVAIVARAGSEAHGLISAADHGPTRREVDAERAVLEALGGGCATPVGVAASTDGDRIAIVAELLAPDGSDHILVEEDLPAERSKEAAFRIGERLKSQQVRLVS